MKPIYVKLEFWTYEETGVQLDPDIWIHYRDNSENHFALRFKPATLKRTEAIEEAKILADLLGVELEIKDTVILLSPEEKVYAIAQTENSAA